VKYTQVGRTHIGRGGGDDTATLGTVSVGVPQWVECREIYAADRVTRLLLEDLFDAGRIVTFVAMCWRRVPRYEAQRRLRHFGDLHVQRYPYIDGWVIMCDDAEGHDEWFIDRPNSIVTASSEIVFAWARDLFGQACVGGM
jgi:hypothetical protein